MSGHQVSRRQLLKRGALLSGGLVVGVQLPGCSFSGPLPIEAADEGFVPHAFLQISPNNEIFFYCPSDEMGQGVRTGLATIIGEELDLHPSQMVVRSAGSHKAYANPEFGIQLTGGSNAVRAFYTPLRQTGADTRALLLNAASLDLGIPAEQLSTDNGHVVAGKRRYPYGDFIGTAATLELPEATPLKPVNQFKYIGSEFTRVDALEKSTGTAQFGIDADIPGMVYAVVARPPVAGAKPIRLEREHVLAMPGIIAVVDISSGVAVVAERYWYAQQGVKALHIEWEQMPLESVDSATVKADLAAALEGNDVIEATNEGDMEAGFKLAKHQHRSDYYAPFLAHAPLEPVNATLRIEGERAELWTGVQSIQAAQGLVERVTGLARGNITVHNLYLGGGFGRRGTLTHIVEVAEIALAVQKPVQLLWSRENDIQNGLYRPASYMRITAGIDDEGRITAWHASRAGANITGDTMTNLLPAMFPRMPKSMLNGLAGSLEYVFSNWAVDPSSVEGLHETYDLPNALVTHATVDHGLPTTFWRSVGHSYTAFAVESMIDELAEQAGMDPIAFRLKNTEGKPRMHRVLRCAADLMANYQLPEGHHLGVACHSSFFTDVAQIAEVSVSDTGDIRVHRVTCVADVGTAVNPDIVKAQLEGAVMFALTATLHGSIDLEAGAVVQSNFHDYPLLRMNEAPEVDVHLIDSGTAPTGIGEPGVPPLAPAVANGVYRAFGERLRTLPLRVTPNA